MGMEKLEVDRDDLIARKVRQAETVVEPPASRARRSAAATRRRAPARSTGGTASAAPAPVQASTAAPPKIVGGEPGAPAGFVRRAHPGLPYPGDDVDLVWSSRELWNGKVVLPGDAFDRSSTDGAKVRRLWHCAKLQEADPQPFVGSPYSRRKTAAMEAEKAARAKAAPADTKAEPQLTAATVAAANAAPAPATAAEVMAAGAKTKRKAAAAPKRKAKAKA